MVGAIGKWDVVTHPWVTVRCFGWRVFLRAVFARRDRTFLSLLTDSEVLKPAGEGVAEFVARCVELELKASRIYAALARRFADQVPVCAFFESLARQENAHAELLELAESAASRQRWDESKAAPWRDVVPRLESHMGRAEGTLGEIHTLREALLCVIDIESSEINDVFAGVVSASDSCFVQRLRVFQETDTRHLSFICTSIAALDPDLIPASQVLTPRRAQPHERPAAQGA